MPTRLNMVAFGSAAQSFRCAIAVQRVFAPSPAARERGVRKNRRCSELPSPAPAGEGAVELQGLAGVYHVFAATWE
jgi:hypothetical protein